ncbi:hypothetical protein [Hyphomonas sp.]|uniref:hypothetical protein n=1 Tax=Hyphomonas sp. TaxID=87 RepID=UPI00391CA8C1
MFGGRPKYDDTFGVPMDLGADRKDPITAPPVKRPPLRTARPVVLVEKPRRLSDIFHQPDNFEWQAQSAQSVTVREAPQQSQSGQDTAESFRRIEAFAASFFQRLSVQHRILLGVVGFWLLISTGLFLPAIIAGIIYLIVRNQKRGEI